MLQQHANFPSELAGEARELRRLARFVVRGDEADDLAQDTMVTALSQRSAPRALRPWLRQVLRNEHRAWARRTQRRRAREDRIAAPCPAPPLDEDAAHAEIILALRKALEELDEPYRDVLRQRFFCDRTASDIARSEGCPAGTVRWRVQEGLRRIRRKLDERFDGRSAWFGGVAAFAGIPVPPPGAATAAGGANTMTNATILKILIATATVAGGTTLLLSAEPDVAPEASPHVAEPARYEASLTPKSIDTSALAFTQAEDDREAAASGLEAAVAPQPDDAVGDQAPECANIECNAEGDGSIANGALEDCFDALGVEHGEMLDVWVTLDDDHVVTKAELDEAIFGDDRDATHCLAEPLTELGVGKTAPEGETTIRLKLQLSDGEGADNGKSKTVDADAPDPEELVAKFSLAARGAKTDAAMKIVECADFDCPFCAKARNAVDRIVADYEDNVAVYWLHNPLPFHPRAEPAARASVAAANQGKFWEMADLLFDHSERRTDDDFFAFAAELGLDADRFAADYAADATAAAVREQAAACTGNGARGTPSFFINGDLLTGAQPYENFKVLIDDELASEAAPADHD